MNNIKSFIGVFILSTTSISSFAESENPCPQSLVSFWKNYIISTQDYKAVPGFLLNNSCVRAVGVSTEFQNAMTNRFDHPDNPTYIDQLYAQLDWKNSSEPIKQ